jgi:hypothetical protein
MNVTLLSNTYTEQQLSLSKPSDNTTNNMQHTHDVRQVSNLPDQLNVMRAAGVIGAKFQYTTPLKIQVTRTSNTYKIPALQFLFRKSIKFQF